MLAGVLAQHDVVHADADGFGRENFVGLLVRQNAVLMDAALMPEGIDADDRLGQRRALADDVVDGLACAGNLRRVDAAGCVAENVRARAHRHHDFLHRGVARAFAQPVDGAFNLPRTA